MSPQNVRSNIEDWFWTPRQRVRHEAEEKWNEAAGPDMSSLKYRQRRRALYIQRMPGYAEKLMEEYEAQLYYNEHKNKKKSDPETYYGARDRLFEARHAVRAMTHQFYTGINQLDAIANSFLPNNDPIAAELDREMMKEWEATRPRSPEEVATAQSMDRTSFADWLTQEIQLYAEFLAQPWRHRYYSMPCLDLSKEVAAERLRYLQALQSIANSAGMEAAYTRYVAEDGYLKLQTQTTAGFTEFEQETASGKDGYWFHEPHSPRPQLLDLVKDAAQIARNKKRYDAHPPGPSVGLAEWFEAKQNLELDSPKQSPGRPKGARNKSYAKPVNHDVERWQAEADEKYPHLKAS